MGVRDLFRKLLGDRGERVAARFLRRAGLKIIGRRYRTRFGEIDLIALDGHTIVFVEVKTRSSAQAGHPFEAVDERKQRKISQSALLWLTQNRRLNQSVRFDVVSIVWPEGAGQPDIQHFRHAFEAISPRQLYG